MSKHDGRKGTAVSTLTYYLQEAFECCDLTWSVDNNVEVEEIIDAIVAEAKFQIQEEEKTEEADLKSIFLEAQFIEKCNQIKDLKKEETKVREQLTKKEAELSNLAAELYEQLPKGYHLYGESLIYVGEAHPNKAYLVEDFHFPEEEI